VKYRTLAIKNNFSPEARAGAHLSGLASQTRLTDQAWAVTGSEPVVSNGSRQPICPTYLMIRPGSLGWIKRKSGSTPLPGKSPDRHGCWRAPERI